MTQKLCSKCTLVKPLSEFRFLKHRGYHISQCKECERIRVRKGVRPTKRAIAVREVAMLCKLFDTGILVEAIGLLKEGKV